MSKKHTTLTESYFNDVYGANEDPWNFETSEYERGKYAATIAALPREQYENAFEIGCSIGVLTSMLAPRCGQLLAVDAAEAPLQKARKRLENVPQVRIEKMAVPQQFPEGSFDLILISEVGYYLSEADLHILIQKCVEQLVPGGNLLLVHWTPEVHDYPLTGDEVHDNFMQQAGESGPLQHLHYKREEKYRLDLFQKRG
jgi:trans-aconitate methyltransferase